MQFTVTQTDLKRALAIAGRAVAGKSTLPVLSNVLIAAEGGHVRVAATNLELGITHRIPAHVDAPGATTIPAKLLTDVVGGLPSDAVTLTLDAKTETTRLTCGRFVSHLKGTPADEYPTIPQIVGDDGALTLPAALLRTAIDQVAFSAATDDSRPVLAGVLLRAEGQAVTLAAADGFRLSRRVIALPEPVRAPLNLIIPARPLREIARAIGDAEAVAVAATFGQVQFCTADTDLVSRLIDGTFPDFVRIIPTQYGTRAILDTAALTRAVKLASYFASASQNVIKIVAAPGDGDGGAITLSANAAEVGDSTGEVACSVAGDDATIALNATYLAEALGAIGAAQVALELQSSATPGVLKAVGDDSYVHLIMPMSVK